MELPSRNTLKWIAIAILATLIIIIILQNIESVRTHVLWVTFEMPRVVLLFLTLGVGVLLGVLGARYYKPRSDRENESP